MMQTSFPRFDPPQSSAQLNHNGFMITVLAVANPKDLGGKHHLILASAREQVHQQDKQTNCGRSKIFLKDLKPTV